MFNRTLAAATMIFSMFTSSAWGDKKTEIVMLSGTGTDDAIEWDFKVSKGRKSDDGWQTIPVPSNWEFHGFGNYNYGHDILKHDEQGHYRREIEAPVSWAGKTVKIVFDGVMTDTEVRLNGERVGEIHQGGFYRFEYDITRYLNLGSTNTLEVLVSKVSSDDLVEQAERKADYWVFGGIYRPVFLEILPGREFIDWVGVDAKADGSLRAVLHHEKARKADKIIAQLYGADGQKIAQPVVQSAQRGASETVVEAVYEGIHAWNAESPVLYRLELQLMDGTETLHTIDETIGFRTIEVIEGKGLFINGSKVELKGVNRHSFYPDTGRATSVKLSYEHVRLIKGMNMNAVRMSHYPPDAHFLKACDELGLYVLNELAGWHRPAYGTEVGKRLVRQMVIRDVNHPSILLWDNGNEGGWNPDLDEEFKKYDPQQRVVIHPYGHHHGLYEKEDGKWKSPFYTDHYNDYETLKKNMEDTYAGLLSMPTEFLHGLYDGGHGAGLDDYWKLMRTNPTNTGGFLWVLADEGAVRTDMDNWIDTDGNHAPDGIVGPYGQKEGSYYTIKEIWSPIRVPMAESNQLPEGFDGTIGIENDYDFTNLNQCSFEWRFETLDKGGRAVVFQGVLAGPDVVPNAMGNIAIDLPDGWESADALYLKALDKNKDEVFTWSWSISNAADTYAEALSAERIGRVEVEETDGYVELSVSELSVLLDKATGRLLKAKNDGKRLPLSNGPQRAESVLGTSSDAFVKVESSQDSVRVRFSGVEGFESIEWTLHANGALELACSYVAEGELPYHGVSFDFEESSIKSKTWQGQGPYRVWKNRLKGTELGVWEIEYNDTETGLKSWIYPEFKGYFGDTRWMILDTDAGEIGFQFESDSYVRLFDFHHVDSSNRGPEWKKEAISGDISFLNAIPPVGTKFKMASELGPQSAPNRAEGLYRVKVAISLL